MFIIFIYFHYHHFILPISANFCAEHTVPVMFIQHQCCHWMPLITPKKWLNKPQRFENHHSITAERLIGTHGHAHTCIGVIGLPMGLDPTKVSDVWKIHLGMVPRHTKIGAHYTDWWVKTRRSYSLQNICNTCITYATYACNCIKCGSSWFKNLFEFNFQCLLIWFIVRKIHQTTISGHSLIELDPLPKDFYIRCLGIFGTSQDKTFGRFGRGRRHLLKFLNKILASFHHHVGLILFVIGVCHRSPRGRHLSEVWGTMAVYGCLQFSNCSEMFRSTWFSMVFYGFMMFYIVLWCFMMFNLN